LYVIILALFPAEGNNICSTYYFALPKRDMNVNDCIATGRIGAMPIYKIDPQTWAHGTDVLRHLFMYGSFWRLKDDQFQFLGWFFEDYSG
jgi:hypothetical protein